MSNYEQERDWFNNLVDCPACKGYGDDECPLCEGNGIVTPKMAADYRANQQALKDEFVWEMMREEAQGL